MRHPHCSRNSEEAWYRHYREQHSKLFEHPIVQRFFENRAHVDALGKYLMEPTEENRLELESSFKRFFFRFRFTKYLQSLITYANIDFHRKRRRDEHRYRLVFDIPLNEEGDISLGELLYHLSAPSVTEPVFYDPKQFLSSIEDERLYAAFSQLTQKQKVVVTLAYSACALDTDIARLMGISQQAITKTRLAALRKMRKAFTPSGKRCANRDVKC
ncbi:MAG: hypothetical protein H0Z34_06930 [Brevibacillus sp.]|nr:hypothetical protein [Brevibacillus sp.]